MTTTSTPIPHTTTTVQTIPPCDFCSPDVRPSGRREAAYDARLVQGYWANVCQEHFEAFGVGLGLGRGQRFILAPVSDTDEPNQRDLIMDAIESGDADAVWDLVGDGDIAEWL
jgi:hypothetical protein